MLEYLWLQKIFEYVNQADSGYKPFVSCLLVVYYPICLLALGTRDKSDTPQADMIQTEHIIYNILYRPDMYVHISVGVLN